MFFFKGVFLQVQGKTNIQARIVDGNSRVANGVLHVVDRPLIQYINPDITNVLDKYASAQAGTGSPSFRYVVFCCFFKGELFNYFFIVNFLRQCKHLAFIMSLNNQLNNVINVNFKLFNETQSYGKKIYSELVNIIHLFTIYSMTNKNFQLLRTKSSGT